MIVETMSVNERQDQFYSDVKRECNKIKRDLTKPIRYYPFIKEYDVISKNNNKIHVKAEKRFAGEKPKAIIYTKYSLGNKINACAFVSKIGFLVFTHHVLKRYQERFFPGENKSVSFIIESMCNDLNYKSTRIYYEDNESWRDGYFFTTSGAYIFRAMGGNGEHPFVLVKTFINRDSFSNCKEQLSNESLNMFQHELLLKHLRYENEG